MPTSPSGVLAMQLAVCAEFYDRHEYESEKRRAFELLAQQIERIVNPPPANVVPIAGAR